MSLERGAAIFAGEQPGYRYSRFANPTVAALEAKMADLEGAPAAVAFASGYGFRPTAERRPMRVVSEEDGEEEIAMTLPLSGDRGGIPAL